MKNWRNEISVKEIMETVEGVGMMAVLKKASDFNEYQYAVTVACIREVLPQLAKRINEITED